MAEECDSGTYHGSYYLFSIPISFMVAFVFLLILQTLQQEWTRRKDVKFQRILMLRIPYIILQFLTIVYLSCSLLLFPLNPKSDTQQNDIFCKSIVYYPLFGVAWCYALYLLMILSRIEISFKDTPLALTKRTKRVLQLSVLAIPLVGNVTLAADTTSHICIATWNAPDLPHEITYCQMAPEDMLLFKTHIFYLLIVSIIALNILFAVLFTFKLWKILKTARIATPRHHDEQLNLKRLMFRNALLTILGTIRFVYGYCLNLVVTM